MDYQLIFLVSAILFGFFMACGIGANDVSNAMGTSVGSKAITVRQAVWIAAIFEFTGALLAGGEVTQTIQSKIVNPALFTGDSFSLGMLSSLISSATWLLLASYFGWPVSTTHTIIGSILGFGIFSAGFNAVYWKQILYLLFSWVSSPILGMTISFFLFYTLQKLIFSSKNPIKASKKVVPFYIFITVAMVVTITVNQLKKFGIDLDLFEKMMVSSGVGFLAAIIGGLYIHKMKLEPTADKLFHFTNVERIFSVLMVFTACAMAFAHGSNDVANAIGPVSAVLESSPNYHLPAPLILFIGGIGIVFGLSLYGYKVMATIGEGITQLTPTRGFAVTLAAAFTVVLASATGIPVSTTHTLVGGILGVGFARGIDAINMSVIKSIFTSWFVTLPVGAILSIFYYSLFKFILY